MAIVTPEVETAGVDFDLELGGRINGSVTSARTGQGLERITVRAAALVGDIEVDVLTDEFGRYRTPVLPAGTYLVWIDGRPHRTGRIYGAGPCMDDCRLDTATGIEVLPGNESPRIDITLD